MADVKKNLAKKFDIYDCGELDWFGVDASPNMSDRIVNIPETKGTEDLRIFGLWMVFCFQPSRPPARPWGC